MAREKTSVRKAKQGKPIRQVAAIPCRLDASGNVEVLLITSNTTRRFIVPKGWPMKGKSARKAAEIEAREEAGVVGRAAKTSVGTYSYWKRLSREFVCVQVSVFLLPVDDFVLDWEEAQKRQRAWLPAADAAALIDETELATIVGSLTSADLGALKGDRAASTS